MPHAFAQNAASRDTLPLCAIARKYRPHDNEIKDPLGGTADGSARRRRPAWLVRNLSPLPTWRVLLPPVVSVGFGPQQEKPRTICVLVPTLPREQMHFCVIRCRRS